VDVYSDYTGIQLSGLTHQSGSPWATTIEMLGSNAVIPNDLIKKYYQDLLESNDEPD